MCGVVLLLAWQTGVSFWQHWGVCVFGAKLVCEAGVYGIWHMLLRVVLGPA